MASEFMPVLFRSWFPGFRLQIGLFVGVAAITAHAAPGWGVALEGNPITAAQIVDAAQATGRALQCVVFFQQWPEQPAAGDFPRQSVEAIAAAGAEPVITWEPMYYRAADGAETMIDAAAILRGDYDDYLRRFARAAAAWRKPLLIRFAHEMNLSRYHWGTTAPAYGPASPGLYQKMVRHVVDLARAEHATNIRWVFCANCDSVPGPNNAPNAGWNTVAAYYPGDAYVDVLGMDGYNWGDTQTPEKQGWRSSWRSFADIFAGVRRELLALAPDKPLYVFETASAPTGGDKRAWIAAMQSTAAAWHLAGLCWFEVRKEVDWRYRAEGGTPSARRSL